MQKDARTVAATPSIILHTHENTSMSIRAFDLIGALVVVSWISLTMTFVYKQNALHKAQTSAHASTQEKVVLSEGETWLMLSRHKQEIGFVHQVRTLLDEGWLLEHDMLMLIDLAGAKQLVETNVRARVSPHAELLQVKATISSFMGMFRILGTLNKDEKVIDITINRGKNSEQRRKLPYNTPPKLSANALNHIIASKNLKPGTTHTHEYFDPVSMGMSKGLYSYIGRHKVASYGKSFDTYHFRQKVMGNELDMYVNDRGEVVIQEFPLGTVGAWIPTAMGRTRSKNLKRQLSAYPVASAQNKKNTTHIKSALEMLGHVVHENAKDKKVFYTIKNTNNKMPLTLTSKRQRLVRLEKENNKNIVIAIGLKEDDKRLVPFKNVTWTKAQHSDLLKMSARINASAINIVNLVAQVDREKPTKVRAKQIAALVQDALKVVPDGGLSSASEVLKRGSGDCTEYALLLVAALRAAHIPARFASGVLMQDDGTQAAHQWVQFYDGTTFLDLDATRKNLEAGPRHIQLFVSPKPEHLGMIHVLDKLDIKTTRP